MCVCLCVLYELFWACGAISERRPREMPGIQQYEQRPLNIPYWDKTGSEHNSKITNHPGQIVFKAGSD